MDNQSQSEKDIRCVIFDLGGVLIELDGPPISPSNTTLNEEQIWQHWLKSKAVRRFESGQCDHREFADGLIQEFGLDILPAQLLEEFESWPVGFYPESDGTIQDLLGTVEIACLSNTNAIHAGRFQSEGAVYSHFDRIFFSHEMGLLKPDPSIYRAVQEVLAIPPEQILFLDDNQMNVDTARDQQWQAERTRGPLEVRQCLKQYNLL